jgi:hypothetical protein
MVTGFQGHCEEALQINRFSGHYRKKINEVENREMKKEYTIIH